MLYVVRRGFKSVGQHWPVGTLLEGTEGIKLWKVKVSERQIIPLPNDKVKLLQLCEVMEKKYSVDLKQKLIERAERIKAQKEVLNRAKEPSASPPHNNGTPSKEPPKEVK